MKVRILLRSIQTENGETASSCLTARGTLDLTADGAKLCYTESEKDGGAAVCITVCGNQTEIDRRGEVSSHLVLENGKTHPCPVQTPYGSFEVCATALALKFLFEKSDGLLVAEYTLDTNGADTRRRIEIRIKEVSPC